MPSASGSSTTSPMIIDLPLLVGPISSTLGIRCLSGQANSVSIWPSGVPVVLGKFWSDIPDLRKHVTGYL